VNSKIGHHLNSLHRLEVTFLILSPALASASHVATVVAVAAMHPAVVFVIEPLIPIAKNGELGDPKYLGEKYSYFFFSMGSENHSRCEEGGGSDIFYFFNCSRERVSI
jgi:hypothetical protein